MDPVEGNIRFSFDPACDVIRPGETAYYRKHFTNFAGGCKETDFIVFDPRTRTLWLLEVKDFRANGRSKDVPLELEISLKIRDTLALLYAATPCANESPNPDADLRGFCGRIGVPEVLRIALHKEEPALGRLFPKVKLEADFSQVLAATLRTIDPHPLVLSLASTADPRIPWTAAPK